MKYRPEIDGLRALAVLPVLLFHAGVPGFSGGFVGVDVFFVISGYLITSILERQLGEGRFSLVDFYERRARRILPALFVVLAVCAPFAWHWMLPDQLMDFGRGLVAVCLFVSNIHFWRETDYFAPAAEENPLLHTWSLAVEEQFYVFFPVMLWALFRMGARRRTRAYVLVAGTVASLALAQWAAREAHVANFFLLPTRAWELGVGALCAMWLQARPQKQSELGAAAGLVLIGASVAWLDTTTPFPSVYALLPVCGAACVVLFCTRETWAGRLLAWCCSAPGRLGLGGCWRGGRAWPWAW